MFFEVNLQQDYKANWKKIAEITYLEGNRQQARYGLTYLLVLK